VKGTRAADPAADPAAELISILNSFHIPLFGQFVSAQSALPAFREKTEALGMQCQDIEWFSRAAMLKITLQVGTTCTSCSLLCQTQHSTTPAPHRRLVTAYAVQRVLFQLETHLLATHLFVCVLEIVLAYN